MKKTKLKQKPGPKKTLKEHEEGTNVTFRLPKWMIDALPPGRAEFVRQAIAFKLNQIIGKKS